MSDSTHSGECDTASCTPRPLTISVQALVERLRNDRYEVSETRAEADLLYRRVWNAVSEHIELVVIPELLARQQVQVGLDELEEVTR